MAVFTVVSSWLLIVVLCTTGSLYAGQEVKLNDETSCKSTYNATHGKVHYSNGASINVPDSVVNCTWNIISPANRNIFLVFDHLHLMDGDNISISSNGTELAFFNPINLTNVVGALPCLTGEKNIMVTLNTTSVKPVIERTLVMYYYTDCAECSHSFNGTKSGSIRAPLYNPHSSAVPANVSLKVSIEDKDSHSLALWLENFVFTNGSVTLSGTATHDGTFNASNTPVVEFLAVNSLEMNISLTNITEKPGYFVARYDTVTSNKICGGDMKVTDAEVSIKTPPVETLQYLVASNDEEINCHWLVETDMGKTLSVSTMNATLSGALSQLVILDGPNRTSPSLFDMNSQDNNQLQAIFSSANYLWISASAPSISKDFMVDLRVSQTKSGGHMRDKGEVKTNGEDKSVFLLETSQGKQAQLVLGSTTVFKDSGTLSFYKDFLASSKPFLTMTGQNKMDIVQSPTGQMAVVTSGFKTSVLAATFDGVDEGCFKYGDGSSGTFSVTGHCNSSCGWMIQPMSNYTGLLAFHFQSLSLTGNDRVIIRMMDANQTQIANISAPTSQMPDLWLPAATGAFVQVTRSECTPDSTIIQSNYQTSPSCAATHTPGVGETVTISSVGYPNHYPLGDGCIWNVTKPNASVFLHVSFADLQLAKEDHVLEVYGANETQYMLLFKSNGTSKDLPMDMHVRGNLMVKFSTKAQMPLLSMPGFSLTVSAVGDGDDLYNSSGEVNTPGFPQPVNGSAFFVWLVQVNSTESQRQIVEFSFVNTTNMTDLENNLKIYDGATLRDGLITNFTFGTVLSRTNQLLFVYQSQGITPASPFKVSYHNFTCNMSMMCDNKICMHEDWHCNGINDCGDFSDEKNCQGGMAPTPAPAPPVPSSDGSKGVSTAALAVGILIALVIGAILGVGAPAAFRRIRGNRFQSYSSFTNNIE